MKAIKNFLAFKVPDNKAYEKRYFSDEFYAMELRRTRYRRLGAVSSVTALAFIGIGLQTHSQWLKRLGEFQFVCDLSLSHSHSLTQSLCSKAFAK